MTIPKLTRDALEFDMHRLSAAPRIIPKLAALVRDPNMNPEDVIEVIRHDPVLTARLIKACKSAALHRQVEITNVIDAVQCLGFAEVYRIATVVAFRSGFSGPFKAYEETADEVWHRAVAVACFMDEFALAEDGDHWGAYTTGLLHMIGIFFIDWHCARTPGITIPLRGTAEQIRIEVELAGFTHMEVSALALDYWGFPREIYEPIRWYHEPARAGEYAHQAEALSLSLDLARAVLANTELTACHRWWYDRVVHADEPLNEVATRVQSRVEAALAFLQV
jgi:HD-like signal output (HDOD) protein